MRRWRRGSGLLIASLVLGSSLACPARTDITTAPDDEAQDDTAFDPGPLEPATPANKGEGEQLDMLIPGVESRAINLADLRGKTVVLAISSTDQDRFDALLSWLEGVQAVDPQTRASILVLSDPEATALDEVMSPIALGWDPQGAVAARLSVARLPTIFVIDAQGSIVVVTPGFEAAHQAQLEAALAP